MELRFAGSVRQYLTLKSILFLIVFAYLSGHTIFDLWYKALRPMTYIEIMISLIMGYLLFKMVEEKRQIQLRLKDLSERQDNLSEELNKLIQNKFEQWSLSLSEKEVALLIIQGLLIKEVAFKRNVTEKTVQAQLSSIYKKSKTKNRSDFTTQFIQLVFDR